MYSDMTPPAHNLLYSSKFNIVGHQVESCTRSSFLFLLRNMLEKFTVKSIGHLNVWNVSQKLTIVVWCLLLCMPF